MMYRIFLLYTLSVLIPCVSNGQNTEEILKKVKKDLMVMSDEDPYKQGFIGFSLRAPSGEEVVRFNASKALTPASNMKVLTTGTALKVLGEEYRYETRLFYTGKIEGGVLNGNIIVQGSGDPTLGSSRISGNPDAQEIISLFASKIKSAGITKINGTIVQDLFAVDKNVIPDGWIWTDIGNYYGAGAFGINFNENLYQVVFKPGIKAGDSTQIKRLEPTIQGLKIDNSVLTGPAGSGDNAWIYGAPFSDYRFMSGTIPAGVNEFTIKGSMPDPPYVLVTLLNEELQKNGVQISGSPIKSSNLKSSDQVFQEPVNLIFKHQSPPLKEIIANTNLYSINLYAEALYNTLEKKFNKFQSEVISEYWKSSGIITEGNFIYDGSGLSPQTGVKPGFLTLVLYEMSKDTTAKSFYSSLPVAGESGTLNRFCKGTAAEKKIHAKSGSMEKVLGYSGYVKGKSGKEYSFSIIVNNYTGRYSSTVQRIEKIMNLLIEL